MEIERSEKFTLLDVSRDELEALSYCVRFTIDHESKFREIGYTAGPELVDLLETFSEFDES